MVKNKPKLVVASKYVCLVLIPKCFNFEYIPFDNLASWIRWYNSDFSDNGNLDLPTGEWFNNGKFSKLMMSGDTLKNAEIAKQNDFDFDETYVFVKQ